MQGESRPVRQRFPVAVHLFLRMDDRVLLSRRYQTGWHDGEYSVPAGHVEAGETVTASAIREAAEELGVSLTPGDLAVVHVMHRRSDDERVDFFCHVRSWAGGIVNGEPDKCDDLRWCALTALPENVIPYIRHALACWQAGLTYSEFGWDQ